MSAIADVAERVEKELRRVQKNGRPYLTFVHGRSTSRPGKRQRAR